MSRSDLRLVLAGIGAGVCVLSAAPAQQVPGGPSAVRDPSRSLTELVGIWQLNDDASREDRRNWRRPVGSTRPFPLSPPSNPAGPAGPVGAGPMGEPGPMAMPRLIGSSFEPELRRALRDLLEIAERYRIAVESETVIFTDDLERVFPFATTGKKEKRRVGATEFEARTIWDGAILRQNIEAVGGFRMSQAFLPGEDRQTLFLSIRVEKPVFVPPIKNITRVYRRAG